MGQEEYIIDFTDLTLNEADGVFKEADKIMRMEIGHNNQDWILRSNLTISSNAGIGSMEAQFHGNKNIYILSYITSIGDLFYNPDIQIFSMWAQENGWNVPQPHHDLVRSNKSFWKHFYDTFVIDSDYLDNLYGKRNQEYDDKEDEDYKEIENE